MLIPFGFIGSQWVAEIAVTKTNNGLNSVQTSLYYLFNDTSIRGGDLVTSTINTVAHGNTKTAYFSNYKTDKYIYLSNSSVAGTDINNVTLTNGTGGSNATYGIYTHGTIGGIGNTLTSRKYTYATDVVGAGSSFGDLHVQYMVATANQSTLYVGGGGDDNGFVPRTAMYKYTFADDSVSGGTALIKSAFNAGATGNYTNAIFHCYNNTSGSYPSVYTNKYTYSGDSVGAGSNIASWDYTTATGNLTFGLFINNETTGDTNKYVYSGDSVSTGTALTLSSGYASGRFCGATSSCHGGL